MSFKNLFLTDRKLQDLNPLDAGEEICKSGKSVGPHIFRKKDLKENYFDIGVNYIRKNIF